MPDALQFVRTSALRDPRRAEMPDITPPEEASP
jgi:hypothetical protein